MAEPKTKPTKQTVAGFIDGLPDAQTRQDCATVAKLMQEATKCEPVMWGTSIIGFDTQTIKYAGGREGDWPLIAFSPRKQNLTLYGLANSAPDSLAKLGKHSLGKGCLYIKRLADIDLKVLKKLISESVKKKR